MKLVTWNVNGLRACLQKGFEESFRTIDADVFCLQETKMQPGQAEINLPGWHQYWFSAQKKGYSGTAVFTKKEPLSVTLGLGIEEFDSEGRAIICEYPSCYVVCVYAPNSQAELARLDYRARWEDALSRRLCELAAQKPVFLCGDLNVAHEEIDLKNPKTNRGSAGFSDEERAMFGALLGRGFVDSFRYFYPDRVAYSWWSYRFHARANNAGWRIDYVVASQNGAGLLRDSFILDHITGSDHCPVGAMIALPEEEESHAV